MRTFPIANDKTGHTVGFQVENAYLSPTTCAGIISTVEGVSDVRKRRPFSCWDEIHIRFRYQGAECVVWEPFGDNSRYWIGQIDAPNPRDMSKIEQAFEVYEPPLHRKIIGDILTLRFLKP